MNFETKLFLLAIANRLVMSEASRAFLDLDSMDKIPESRDATCALKDNPRCQTSTGKFNMVITACGDTHHTTTNADIEYLCTFLDNCDDHPSEWKCLSNGLPVPCFQCITKMQIQKSKISHMRGKEASDYSEEHEATTVNQFFGPRQDLLLIICSSLGLLVSLFVFYLYKRKQFNNIALIRDRLT